MASYIEGDIGALVEALERLLAIVEDRAVVAVLVAPDEETTRLSEQIEALFSPAESALCEIHTSLPRDRLRTLNMQRDLLISGLRLLVLRVSTEEELQSIHRHATDLAAFIDATLRFTMPAGGADWPVVAEQIRSLMRARHHFIDLTGLVPADAARKRLPLDQLYMELVDLQAPMGLHQLPALLGLPFEAPRESGNTWLVTGAPGSGKTTFLRRLAMLYSDLAPASDPLEIDAAVPILIPLADYANDRERRVRPFGEFLIDWLRGAGISHPEDALARSDELAILLDGLDEVPSREARRDLLDAIHRFRAQHPPAAMIVTSRGWIVDELRALDERAFLIRSCSAPGDEAIQRYLRCFMTLRAVDDTERERFAADAEAVGLRISEDADLTRMAQSPLLLVFLALLHQLEGRLPERRTLLYHRLGQILIERWARSRSLAGQSQPRRESPADALRILGPMAWWILERGGGAVEEGPFRAELIRLQVARGEEEEDANERADAWLQSLREDTALLIPQGAGRWAFIHPTLAEYFAGVEMIRDRARWEQVLSDPFRARYRDVIVFCAGELSHIRADDERLDELVRRILEKSRRPGRYDARYPGVVTGLIKEEIWPNKTLRKSLVGRLGEFWFAYRYGESSIKQIAKDFKDLGSTMNTGQHKYLHLIVSVLKHWASSPEKIAWLVLDDLDEHSRALEFLCLAPLFMVPLSLPITPLTTHLTQKPGLTRLVGWHIDIMSRMISGLLEQHENEFALVVGGKKKVALTTIIGAVDTIESQLVSRADAEPFEGSVELLEGFQWLYNGFREGLLAPFKRSAGPSARPGPDPAAAPGTE